ncbi:MAG TPA: cell division protein FtsW [Candidatus Alectryocaccobium stercorigallinarum]|jgi:cell division protein FtsW|nr:cell division protein FtsW [Candidatus Alectryocaccobium stercorigallinarum]
MPAKGNVKVERKIRGYYDYNLLAVVIILICFGLVMLYSASSYEATEITGNDMHYLTRQGAISAVAILFAIIISKIDYHFFLKLSGVLYFLSLLLMAAVKYSPLGVEYNGARRWLGTDSFQFQPSEIAKIAVILFVTSQIIRMGRDFYTFKGVFIVFIYGFLQAFGAYYFTDNLSTAIIIMAIDVLMIFVAHPKTKPFIVIFLILVVVVIAAVVILSQIADSGDGFRIRRVLTWLDPEKYSEYGGFQVLQGLYAIGSGGFFGKGLGNSTQKLSAIPEAQNDMIFSVICEELGLFGAIILLLLFGYLLYRLMWIAQNAADLKGCLIASGVFIHIALQVVLNICVVLNVIPTTGVTLPFVSYGGTSVLFLMGEIGLVLGVASRIEIKVRKVPEERKANANIQRTAERSSLTH